MRQCILFLFYLSRKQFELTRKKLQVKRGAVSLFVLVLFLQFLNDSSLLSFLF